MSTITEQSIKELAGFDSGGAPVTTLYLDVDGRRWVHHRDYEAELERMLRGARSNLASVNGDAKAASDDLIRIERFVKGGLERSQVRGLAVFACGPADLWHVVELAVPVTNQLVVNKTPYVRQLERVLHDYEPLGVLLADRQRARMFVFDLGVLVDKQELFDQLPRHDDDGGTWDKEHVADHTDAAVAHHLRATADVALKAFQTHEFVHLVVGAPDDIASTLEGLLHPYLKQRLAGRMGVRPGASDDEIRAAALAMEEEIERRREAELVARLRDAAGSGAAGVVGLDATLQRLQERRVDVLLVSRGFEAPGWRCEGCRAISSVGRTCKVCSAEMEPVDDVVEEAIEEALLQSCRVDICTNADLDVLGRIGALLRY